jgi:hypothetical protein
MPPITATPEEAEELRKIVVSGVAKVLADGREVTYRPQADLERTLGEAQPPSGGSGSEGNGGGRRRYAQVDSGW